MAWPKHRFDLSDGYGNDPEWERSARQAAEALYVPQENVEEEYHEWSASTAPDPADHPEEAADTTEPSF